MARERQSVDPQLFAGFARAQRWEKIKTPQLTPKEEITSALRLVTSISATALLAGFGKELVFYLVDLIPRIR